jgi:methionyl-tRNA formyltransferase
MKGKKGFRLIFMGTPQFAVPALERLHASDFEVVAVVTATDKKGGRGQRQLLQSAVKKFAVQAGIPVLQPKNLKAPSFLEELRAFEADLQVVLAFRMLPEVVWNMPPLGTVNLHASLLPKYRGAAPIHWAIINGEKTTGLPTFRLKHEIDTGDIIEQVEMPVDKDDTMGSLAIRMSQKGADLLLSTVESLYQNTATFESQNMKVEAPSAPKIFFEDAKINFNQKTQKTYDFIRGMSPYPAAWTKIDDKIVKLYEVTPHFNMSDTIPGTIEENNGQLMIHCRDGKIEIESLKVEGKKRLKAKDWLNGHQINSFTINE